MKHKGLAYLLAIVFVMQMFIVGTPAVYSAENDSADSRVVRLITALNIMELDEYTGNFWDETPVKRSVMAEIICRLFAYEPVLDEVAKFTDVQELDRAHVETVVRYGHMSGYNHAEFGPDDYITGEQLIKIFVTLLDAGSFAEGLGGFPQGYIQAGQRLGIIDNSISAAAKPARRIDVANMIYNTLNAEILQITGTEGVSVNYDTVAGETFLTEKLGIYQNKGIMKKNEATSLSRPDGLGRGLVEINGTVYRDDDQLTDGFLGCNVKVFVKKTDKDDDGNIIYIEENHGNEIIDVSGEDIEINPTTDREVSYYLNDKKKTIKISVIADMIYNGKSITLDMNRIKKENCFVRFIDNDDNNEFDVVVVNSYNTFVVDRVNADEGKILLRYGERPILLEDGFVRITRDGVKSRINEIGIGEVALVAVSDGTNEPVIDIKISTKVAIGNIEGIKTDSSSEKRVVIGGEEYSINSYSESLVSRGYLKAIAAGLTGRFFIDANGGIAYYTLDSGGENIGYLINHYIKDADETPKLAVRICTQNKKIETYTSKEYVFINGKKKDVSDIVGNAALIGQLNTPQLIKYEINQDVLKKITFASDGYDSNEFSLDLERTLECTSTSILDEKYYVSAETIVFYVPHPDGITYEDVKYDTGKYRILTGSWFGQGSIYPMKVYDITEDGMIKYAVYMKDYRWSQIGEGEPWLAVTDVGEAVNSDGDVVKVLVGYNESGKEQRFEIAEAEILNADVMSVSTETGCLTDSGSDRLVASGDLIQYHIDSKGKLDEVKIILTPDINAAYYTPISIVDSEECKTKIVYGEVMRCYSDHLLLSCKPIWQDMTPMDADKYISNTGLAVYEYDFETQKFYSMDFGEIETEDKVFACVNGANRTRILVVYK